MLTLLALDKNQAGAELGQAQVKLDDIAEVVVYVVMISASIPVGGWSDKMKIILISVELEVELGKNS